MTELPYRRKEIIGDCTLYLGDCRDILPTLGKVDAVVTDPPYGIGHGARLHSEIKKRTGIKPSNWDSSAPDLSILPDVPSIVWGGNYFSLPPTRCFLFWDKHPMPPTYAAGELAWTSLDRNAAKWCGKVGDEVPVKDRSHPTQKPLGLMKWCLEFLPEAQTILDPFMGSGTTGVACIKLGKSFIGIEREPDYFEIACERIRKAYAQPDMFIAPPSPKPKQEAMI